MYNASGAARTVGLTTEKKKFILCVKQKQTLQKKTKKVISKEVHNLSTVREKVEGIDMMTGKERVEVLRKLGRLEYGRRVNLPKCR